jgi:hypothetical protein
VTDGANNGTGVVCVGTTEAKSPQGPIMWILNQDLMQVGAGKIGPRFEMVFRRCIELCGKRTEIIGPCWVEDSTAGSIILENYRGTQALSSTWLARGKIFVPML